MEHLSKTLIVLPIKVGPTIQDTLFQLLDLDLGYNILLNQPWIHTMHVIPSTYPQHTINVSDSLIRERRS